MADTQLIVSNPPHSEPDPTAIAPFLNCSAAEARIKLNFPAPEIWAVEPEKAKAGQVAKQLLDLGAKVAWIPGSVLASVPSVSAGSANAVGDQTVTIRTNAGEIVIKKGEQAVAVLGEPVQQAARMSGESASMLSQKMPGLGGEEPRDSGESRLGDPRLAEPTELFLDIYAYGEAGWKSARLAPSFTDFAGLGDHKQPMAKANIGVIVDLLKSDYGARVDERLMKVSYKAGIISGLAVNQILSSISEQLGTLTLLDIGSQLAFLTSKG